MSNPASRSSSAGTRSSDQAEGLTRSEAPPVCGSGKDAVGAAAAAIGVNIGVGLLSGLVGTLAGYGANGTPEQRARSLKRSAVTATAFHGAVTTTIGLLSAERHPFFSGATTFIGVGSLGLTAIAVMIPARDFAPRPADSPAPTLGSPAPSSSPLVSPGGQLGVGPMGPAIDPLRLASFPRSQRSLIDPLFHRRPAGALEDKAWYRDDDKGAGSNGFSVPSVPGGTQRADLSDNGYTVYEKGVSDVDQDTGIARGKGEAGLGDNAASPHLGNNATPFDSCWASYLLLPPALQARAAGIMVRQYVGVVRDSSPTQVALRATLDLIAGGDTSQNQRLRDLIGDVPGYRNVVCLVMNGAEMRGAMAAIALHGSEQALSAAQIATYRRWLQQAGSGSTSADEVGTIGPATRRAVLNFQARYPLLQQARVQRGLAPCVPAALSVDGILGPLTRSALDCMFGTKAQNGNVQYPGRPALVSPAKTVRPGGALGGAPARKDEPHGWLDLHVLPIDATLLVDGLAVPNNFYRLAPGDHDLVVQAPGCVTVRRRFSIVASGVTAVSARLKRITVRPKTPRPTALEERDLSADQIDLYRQLLWENGSPSDVRRGDAPGTIGPSARDAIASFQAAMNLPDPPGVSPPNTCGGLEVNGLLDAATRRALECWGPVMRRRMDSLISRFRPGGAIAGGGHGVVAVRVRSNVRTQIAVNGSMISGRAADVRLPVGSYEVEVTSDCGRSLRFTASVEADMITDAPVDLFC